MPRIKIALIFIKIGLKRSYFCQRNKKFRALGGSAPTPYVYRGRKPCFQTPPIASGSLGIFPQIPRTTSPRCRFLAALLHEQKFTARYCRPPFTLAFCFKCVWNVWQRRLSHSQMVYNTAKSISLANTYTKKLSQKILSSAPTPFWLWQ